MSIDINLSSEERRFLDPGIYETMCDAFGDDGDPRSNVRIGIICKLSVKLMQLWNAENETKRIETIRKFVDEIKVD